MPLTRFDGWSGGVAIILAPKTKPVCRVSYKAFPMRMAY